MNFCAKSTSQPYMHNEEYLIHRNEIESNLEKNVVNIKTLLSVIDNNIVDNQYPSISS